MEKLNRVAIYGRVSTGEQSVDMQVSELTDYAQNREIDERTSSIGLAGVMATACMQRRSTMCQPRPARSPSRLATLSIESSDKLCCLPCRFDCYRVERISSRAGLSPAEVQRRFTAHCFIN